MKKIIILAIFCICAFSQTIKIATYNVENLFDGKRNGNEYRDFKKNWGEWQYYEKLRKIKSVIKWVNADIIALQEIENKNILKDLIADTQYKFISFCSPKGAPVGLGLISKIKPSSNAQCISVKDVKTRDILKQSFKIQEQEFNIFVNHFPAFKNGINAQQKAAKTLFNAVDENELNVILGDFNTAFGSKNILTPLEVNKNLKNLWRELKPKERFSFVGYGKKRAIDHILLSQNLTNKKAKLFYVCKSFSVFTKNLVDENGYAKAYKGKNIYSDHLPLVFEISTDKTKSCGFLSEF